MRLTHLEERWRSFCNRVRNDENGEQSMKNISLKIKNISDQSADVLIDGCPVKLHFAKTPLENIMGRVQGMLLASVTNTAIDEKNA